MHLHCRTLTARQLLKFTNFWIIFIISMFIMLWIKSWCFFSSQSFFEVMFFQCSGQVLCRHSVMRVCRFSILCTYHNWLVKASDRMTCSSIGYIQSNRFSTRNHSMLHFLEGLGCVSIVRRLPIISNNYLGSFLARDLLCKHCSQS